MEDSGAKVPLAVPVTEKQAGGVIVEAVPVGESPSAIVKRPKRPKRKTSEEKRVAALKMIDWATDISGKHPNLVHEFLNSRDERVRYECWKTITAYRWGLPTGRVEVDLQAAARVLAASRGVSAKALLDRAAKIVDAVTTVEETIEKPDKVPVASADEPTE